MSETTRGHKIYAKLTSVCALVALLLLFLLIYGVVVPGTPVGVLELVICSFLPCHFIVLLLLIAS